MMYHNEQYMDDVRYVAKSDVCRKNLQNKRIMITGASGMIGSFLIDVIMFGNREYHDHCRIVAVVRNEKRARERFSDYLHCHLFRLVTWDINDDRYDVGEGVDYIIHAASNTHPLAYAERPIDTITTNLLGTHNLLNYFVQSHAQRFLLLSSVEIYGENRGDIKKFNESYSGYIDCNTLRAGYPESKRTAEALCQAFIKEKGIDCVIARLARTYGPTMLRDDTKALSQFIKRGIASENIVLKSDGKQYYSYIYVEDAVSAVLEILFRGLNGEAYNISDASSDIHLKDLAGIVAAHAGTEVIYEIPDDNERKGYSTATNAVMENRKLRDLGWKSHRDIDSGIKRTIDILRESGII